MKRSRNVLVAKSSLFLLFCVGVYNLASDLELVRTRPDAGKVTTKKPVSDWLGQYEEGNDGNGYTDDVTSDTRPNVKKLKDWNFLPPRTPSAVLIHQARDFLTSRKQAYDAIGLGVNWHLRGIAHLAEHRDMILAGELLLPDNQTALAESSSTTRGQVILYNVHPKALEEAKGAVRTDCHLLTVWVRVRGPEVFAGSAKAVQPGEDGHCYWTFEFDLQIPGDYRVESKVLLWNGNIKHDGSNRCEQQKGQVPPPIVQKYPVHAGFRGFKVYAPGIVCCEVCSRQKDPPCRYWATPPEDLEKPSFVTNGCELYFDKEVQSKEVPFRSALLRNLDFHNFTGFDLVLQGTNHKKQPSRYLRSELGGWGDAFLQDFLKVDASTRHRRLKGVEYFHGYPHNAPTPYFVGCGWNQMFTLDFPCISGELDDKVVLAQESFTYHSFTPKVQELADALPLCQHQDELMDTSNGRWVKLPWPNETECPLPFQFDRKHRQRFRITEHDPDRPHCWHRDDLTILGLFCAEPNCRFIYTPSRFVSSFREKQWMGIWRQYDCDYYEYTNEQLEQCFETKKIGRFKFNGRSVADSYKQNVLLRLEKLRLYNKTAPDAVTVTLSTLALLHEPAHADEEIVRKWAKQHKDLKNSSNEIWYIANGFYLTSERETFCFVERMRQFNYMVENHFLPKGYHVLSAFDLSKALSYETAGQFDGMHLIGPAMKAITVKLFHHLCHDVVEGIRRM